MPRLTKILASILLVLVLFDLFVWWADHRAHPGVLTLAFLDIGQGDAVFIEAPNGNQLLYDAGPNAIVMRALGGVMPFFDHSIDVAMLSHPDLDHVGGFTDVLSRMSVRVLMDSRYGGEVKNAAYDEIFRIATARGVPELPAWTGTRITLDQGVYLDVLYPDAVVTSKETNDASVVLKLTYGSTTALFSGDLPAKMEGEVVARYGSALDVDIFKAGHHGSKTANSEMFLRAMSPALVVISAGLHNKYGHPHKEVLDRLAALGIPYLGTYLSGTVRLESTGGLWRVISP